MAWSPLRSMAWSPEMAAFETPCIVDTRTSKANSFKVSNTNIKASKHKAIESKSTASKAVPRRLDSEFPPRTPTGHKNTQRTPVKVELLHSEPGTTPNSCTAERLGLTWLAVPDSCTGLTFRVVNGNLIQALDLSEDQFTVLAIIEVDSTVVFLSCSNDASMVACACVDGSLKLFNVEPFRGFIFRWQVDDAHSYIMSGDVEDERELHMTSGPLITLSFSASLLLLVDAFNRNLKVFLTDKAHNPIGSQLRHLDILCAAWGPKQSKSIVQILIGDSHGVVHMYALDKVKGTMSAKWQHSFRVDTEESFACTHLYSFNRARTVIGCFYRLTRRYRYEPSMNGSWHEMIYCMSTVNVDSGMTDWKRLSCSLTESIASNSYRPTLYSSELQRGTNVLLLASNVSSDFHLLRKVDGEWKSSTINEDEDVNEPSAESEHLQHFMGHALAQVTAIEGPPIPCILKVSSYGSISCFKIPPHIVPRRDTSMQSPGVSSNQFMETTHLRITPAEVSRRKKELKEARNCMFILKSENEELKSENARLKAELYESKEEITSTRSEKTELLSRSNSEIDRFRLRLKHRDAEIVDLKRDLCDLEEALQQVQEEMMVLQIDILTKSGEVEALSASEKEFANERDELKESLRRLEAEKRDLEDEINVLVDANQAKGGEIDLLSELNAAERADFQVRLKQLELENSALEQSFNELLEEKVDLVNKLEQTQNRTFECESPCSSHAASQDCPSIYSIKEELTFELESMHSVNAEWATLMDKMDFEKNSLIAEHERLCSLVHIAVAETDETRAELDDVLEENNRMSARLEQIEHELEFARKICNLKLVCEDISTIKSKVNQICCTTHGDLLCLHSIFRRMKSLVDDDADPCHDLRLESLTASLKNAIIAFHDMCRMVSKVSADHKPDISSPLSDHRSSGATDSNKALEKAKEGLDPFILMQPVTVQHEARLQGSNVDMKDDFTKEAVIFGDVETKSVIVSGFKKTIFESDLKVSVENEVNNNEVDVGATKISLLEVEEVSHEAQSSNEKDLSPNLECIEVVASIQEDELKRELVMDQNQLELDPASHGVEYEGNLRLETSKALPQGSSMDGSISSTLLSGPLQESESKEMIAAVDDVSPSENKFSIGPYLFVLVVCILPLALVIISDRYFYSSKLWTVLLLKSIEIPFRILSVLSDVEDLVRQWVAHSR